MRRGAFEEMPAFWFFLLMLIPSSLIWLGSWFSVWPVYYPHPCRSAGHHCDRERLEGDIQPLLARSAMRVGSSFSRESSSASLVLYHTDLHFQSSRRPGLSQRFNIWGFCFGMLERRGDLLAPLPELLREALRGASCLLGALWAGACRIGIYDRSRGLASRYGLLMYRSGSVAGCSYSIPSRSQIRPSNRVISL